MQFIRAAYVPFIRAFVHSLIHRVVHWCIPYIYNLVKVTICRVRYRYIRYRYTSTQQYKIYSTKCYKYFVFSIQMLHRVHTVQLIVYESFLTIRISSGEWKACVFTTLDNADLNWTCTCSFLNLYLFILQLNFFENALYCLHWSPFMKVHIHMEWVRYVISLTGFYVDFCVFQLP